MIDLSLLSESNPFFKDKWWPKIFLEERTFAVQSFGEEAGKEVLPWSKENFYTH